MNPRYLNTTLAIGNDTPELVELELTFGVDAGMIFLDQAWVLDIRHRRSDAPQWLYRMLQDSPAVAEIIRREGHAIRAEWGLTMDRAA